MADNVFAFSWNDVIARLRAESPDTVIEIRGAEVPHPTDAGMCRTESKGEDRRPQFGLILDENLACHVLVCGDWYHTILSVHQSAELVQSSEPEVLDRNEALLGKREARSSSLATAVADNPGLTLGVAAVSGAKAPGGGGDFGHRPKRGYRGVHFGPPSWVDESGGTETHNVKGKTKGRLKARRVAERLSTGNFGYFADAGVLRWGRRPLSQSFTEESSGSSIAEERFDNR